MYITVTTSNDMDFDDIYRNAWNGAVDTLDIISNEGKENDLMEFLDIVYPDEEVETIKKQLRKGHDLLGVGRFVIHYREDMR